MVEGLALLTEAAEQVALSRILRSFRPDLTIWPVADIEELRSIDPVSLHNARLVAFASGVIVPPDLLARFGRGAYNFHPGHRTIRAGRRPISRSMTARTVLA